MASMTSVRLYVVTTFLVGFMFKGAANFSKRVGYSKYSQVVAFKGSQINGLQISRSRDMHKVSMQKTEQEVFSAQLAWPIISKLGTYNHCSPYSNSAKNAKQRSLVGNILYQPYTF